MTDDEEQPAGGGASPRHPTRMATIPVTTGHPQIVHVPGEFTIVLTVRDRVGSPLAGIVPEVLVDDVALATPVPATDATGLTTFRVAPTRQVTIGAGFPAAPSTAIAAPGSRTTASDSITFDVHALTQQALPPPAPTPARQRGRGRARPRPPTPAQRRQRAHDQQASEDAVATTVYVTLRPIVRYALRHLFPWQNAVLRADMFHELPSTHDRGGRETREASSSGDARDRVQRLRDFVQLYRTRVPGPAGLPGSPSTTEVDAIDHAAERVRRIDARLRALDAELHLRRHHHGAAPRRHAGDDEVETELLEEDRAGGYADPAAEHARLTARRDEIMSQGPHHGGHRRSAGAGGTRGAAQHPPDRDFARERRDAQSRAQEAQLTSMTHRELVTFIVDHIFAHDVGSRVVPDWVRYAVMHMSGLRYRNAHHSYYPPQWIVFSLRGREIDETEFGAASGSGRPSDERLITYASELLSMLRREDALTEAVDRRFHTYDVATTPAPHVGSGSGSADRISPAVAVPRLELVLASLRGGSGGSGSGGSGGSAPDPVATIRTVWRCLAKYWTELMNLESLARAAITSPRPSTGRPIDEALGLLKHRVDTGVITTRAWPRIVQRTELRNDFVTATPWEIAAPASGAPDRADFDADTHLLFSGSAQQQWKQRQHLDLTIGGSRAVCNQVSEMICEARGISLRGGITENARYSAYVHAADDADDEQTGGDQYGEILRTIGAGAPAHVQGHILFRPTAARQIHRGDLVFFLSWRPIPQNDEPWSIVPLGMDMEYIVARYPQDMAAPELGHGQPTGTSRPVDTMSLEISPVEHPDGRVSFIGLADVTPWIRRVTDASGPSGTPPLGTGEIGVARTNIRQPPPRGQSASSQPLVSPTHPLAWMLVRRHPSLNEFREALVWSHQATVIDVRPSGAGGIITFETNEPTGVRRRTWAVEDPPGNFIAHWNVRYARPAAPAVLPPHLAYYLDRDNLLGAIDD